MTYKIYIMKTLFTLMIALLITSTLISQDLIRNGSFENTNHLEYWTANISVNGASIEAVNSEYYDGSWSMELDCGVYPVGNFTWVIQELLAPSSNSVYKLTFWFKGVIGDNSVAVYGVPSGGSDVALGVDAMNTGSNISASSGAIEIDNDFYTQWTGITYYFNSGDYPSYILKFGVATGGNSYDTYWDKFSAIPDAGVGIDDLNLSIPELNVYPNPMTSTVIVTFSVDQSSEVSIDLLNLTGQPCAVLYEGYAEAGDHEVQMKRNDLPSGMYMLRMTTKDNRAIKKIIIE